MATSLLCQLPSIATLGAFCPFSSVFGEESATFGAALGEGLKIGGK